LLARSPRAATRKPVATAMAADWSNVDPGGQLDMQQLLAAAQQMQEQLLNAQEELADAEVEGSSGGGLVKAIVNGQGELVELTIAAAAIDPASPEETAQTVADLVLAAVRDANRAVGELQQEKMGPFAAGFGGAPGGFGDTPGGDTGIPGLPGFPGLPGLGGPGTEPADGSAGPAGGQH
jgi:nucleoid-associated protein EbfC